MAARTRLQRRRTTSLARRCSSGTSSGSDRRSSVRSISRKRPWSRNESWLESDGSRGRLVRGQLGEQASQRGRPRAPRHTPVPTDNRGPSSASRSAGWPAETSPAVRRGSIPRSHSRHRATGSGRPAQADASSEIVASSSATGQPSLRPTRVCIGLSSGSRPTCASSDPASIADIDRSTLPKLKQESLRAHTAERQRRLAARGDRELRSLREPVERPEDCCVQRFGRNHVAVVEDQNKAAWRSGIDPGGLQCTRDRARQRFGIVVGMVQRHPGTRTAAFGHPLREQRGLAVTGGRGQQNQGTAPLLLKPSEEIVSPDGVPPYLGTSEFRVRLVESPRARAVARAPRQRHPASVY